MNNKIICIYSFTLTKIILDFILKLKIIKTNKEESKIKLQVIEKTSHKDFNLIEEGLNRINIEKQPGLKEKRLN